MSEMLQRVVKENSSDVIRTHMKKVAATFLNQKKISAQEAAYQLQTSKCVPEKMSRKVLFVDSSHKNNRVRLSKPYEETESKKDDDQNYVFSSTVENCYLPCCSLTMFQFCRGNCLH